jgi:hypothetical protein
MTPTNALTTAILYWLCYNGHEAWRENNNSVYSPRQGVFRKPGKFAPEGIADVCFIERGTGKHCEIEVKTGDDKQSKKQVEREARVKRAGGKYFVVHNFDEFEVIAKQQGWVR